jgi:mannose/fructose/N-acetylgalactosamine-specific phosphotransferase system component IID
MYLIAIGWIYVVLMMALAEALSPQGSVLGAFFTFVLYGVLPLAILLYILATPARKRALKAAEAGEAAAAAAAAAAASAPPDGRGHAAGDPVAAERKEG